MVVKKEELASIRVSKIQRDRVNKLRRTLAIVYERDVSQDEVIEYLLDEEDQRRKGACASCG